MKLSVIKCKVNKVDSSLVFPARQGESLLDILAGGLSHGSGGRPLFREGPNIGILSKERNMPLLI